MSSSQPSLWLCADLDGGLADHELVARVRAIAAVRPCVAWLRASLSVPARRVYETAKALRETRALLFVGDRLDVALAVDAHGVHLGSRGVHPATARALITERAATMRISSAVHDAYAVRTLAPFSDALVLSPFAHVPGKAPPLGLAGFAHAVGAAPAAFFVALGGIANTHEAHDARAAGASAIAVRRALLAGSDPVRACIALDEAFSRSGT